MIAKKRLYSFFWDLLSTASNASPRLFYLSLILGLLAAIFQLGIISLLYIGIEYLDKFALTPSESISFAINFKGIFLILAFASIFGFITIFVEFLKYKSQRYARAVGRRSHEHLLKNALQLNGTNYPSKSIKTSPDIHLAFTLAFNRDVRICGLAIEQLITLFQIAVFAFTYFIALFFIDFWATISVVFVGCLFIPVVIRFTKSTKANAQSFNNDSQRSLNIKLNQLLRSQYSKIIPTVGKTSQNVNIWSNIYNELLHANDDYDNYILASDKTVFFSAIVRTACAISVITIIGVQAVNGSLSISIIAIYLLGLFRAAGYFTGILNYYTNLTRFYPMIQNYYEIIDSLSSYSSGSDNSLVSFDQLHQPKKVVTSPKQKGVIIAIENQYPVTTLDTTILIKHAVDQLRLSINLDSILFMADNFVPNNIDNIDLSSASSSVLSKQLKLAYVHSGSSVLFLGWDQIKNQESLNEYLKFLRSKYDLVFFWLNSNVTKSKFFDYCFLDYNTQNIHLMDSFALDNSTVDLGDKLISSNSISQSTDDTDLTVI